MNYISPFHIINFNDIQTPSKEELRRAKKRYLAEFELVETTTINIKGQALDKNDLLNFFTRLEADQDFNFHQIIFQDKPLLGFLERGELAFFLQPRHGHYWSDRAFLKFIAPYFTTQFDRILLQAVKQQDETVIQQLFNIIFPLPQRYESMAYKSTYRYFYGQILELEAGLKKLRDNIFIPDSELITYIHPTRISLLNILPAYFEGSRNAYAMALQKLAILLHNEFKRTSLARDLLEGGLHLTLDAHTTNQLEDILNQLGGRRIKAKDFINETAITILGILLIGLTLLLFLKGCG